MKRLQKFMNRDKMNKDSYINLVEYVQSFLMGNTTKASLKQASNICAMELNLPNIIKEVDGKYYLTRIEKIETKEYFKTQVFEVIQLTKELLDKIYKHEINTPFAIKVFKCFDAYTITIQGPYNTVDADLDDFVVIDTFTKITSAYSPSEFEKKGFKTLA